MKICWDRMRVWNSLIILWSTNIRNRRRRWIQAETFDVKRVREKLSPHTPTCFITVLVLNIDIRWSLHSEHVHDGVMPENDQSEPGTEERTHLSSLKMLIRNKHINIREKRTEENNNCRFDSHNCNKNNHHGSTYCFLASSNFCRSFLKPLFLKPRQ